MSHEIRTPNEWRHRNDGPCLALPPIRSRGNILSAVKISADSLLVVINDILDFSKIEAGKMELDQAVVDVRTMVAGALKTVALRANEKNLELTALCSSPGPRQVIRRSGGCGRCFEPDWECP